MHTARISAIPDASIHLKYTHIIYCTYYMANPKHRIFIGVAAPT